MMCMCVCMCGDFLLMHVVDAHVGAGTIYAKDISHTYIHTYFFTNILTYAHTYILHRLFSVVSCSWILRMPCIIANDITHTYIHTHTHKYTGYFP
jgi:hypothetical protein